jgi:ADP-ribosylglycohydrolase
MLGQIAGDALGSMVEFQGPAQIQREFPGGPRHISGSRQFQTLPGQPTDDSELALLLARSIIHSGGYDQEAAAKAYAWWYESGPFDIGNATKQALRAAWDAGRKGKCVAVAAEKAADPVTQANGALMRVSPLGIFGWSSGPSQLAAHARMDARLTHPSPVTQDANAAYVLTIARAIRVAETPAELHRFALWWVKDHKVDPAVIQAVEEAGTEPPPDFLTHQGWVIIALQNAFYQLLHAPSIEEGIVDTVRHGGDTDTNAAIAGALLGAVHGLEAVPDQWREAVLDCRPEHGRPGVQRPRPPELWPTDCLDVALELSGLGE